MRLSIFMLLLLAILKAIGVIAISWSYVVFCAVILPFIAFTFWVMLTVFFTWRKQEKERELEEEVQKR